MAKASTPTPRRRRAKLDPFTSEIIRSYLLSTVREMVNTTIRTAYSTCFSEGEDFTCALFDSKARMIAQAQGQPIHAGALFDAMKSIVNTLGSFDEGDVIVFNDPYDGGSHQADVVVARPMFVGGKHIGFAVNRGHWMDIGGMSPGGWSGTVSHVIQEALIIPPVKLYKGGVLDREIKDFILRNVRLPKQCWGDLQAQIACNIAGERRIRSLVEKYGMSAVQEACEQALEYSQRRLKRALEALPDGTWEGEDYQEDDGHGGGPYRVHVTVTKKGGRIYLDFNGTDPQVRGPVNASWTGTKAACYSVVLAISDPEIPLNEGFLELVEITAPKGCLVNPVYPAPVFATTADPINKVYESIMKACAQWVPDRVTAGGFCTGQNYTGSGDVPGELGEEFLWYVTEPGGTGARATRDGNNVDFHLMGNPRNQSLEIWEARYPLRIEKYEMVPESGGPGKYRGGVGVVKHMRVLLPTVITGCADRHQIPPWGLDGGKEGMLNKVSVIRDDKEWSFPGLFGTISPSKFSLVPQEAGDIFCLTQGGGGGYGDPLERDPKMVEWDVLNGYVSLDGAKRDYGVWIDAVTGQVDLARTSKLREQLTAERRQKES